MTLVAVEYGNRDIRDDGCVIVIPSNGTQEAAGPERESVLS